MEPKQQLGCEEVLDKLGEFLDEDARAELCEAIEAHLSRCRDCQVQVDTLKKTILLYQADRVVEVPMAVSQKLGAALHLAYQNKPESATD